MAKNQNWQRLNAHWKVRKRQNASDVLEKAQDTTREVRGWLNRHTIVGGTVLGVIIVACWVHVLWGGAADHRPHRPDPAYLYDLGSGKLYPGAPKGTDAITGPSGSEAVRAYVFACSSCQTGSFIGFLMKYGDATDSSSSFAADVRAYVALVPESKSAADLKWAPIESDEGSTITGSLSSHCQGQQPKVCRPDE